MIRLPAVFVVVCGFACMLPGSVRAHPIAVNGDPTDWPMVVPAQGNLGHISRNALSQGEYVWIDVQGDERTDFASPDTRVDLLEFRVTGDQSNLYFMARMQDIDVDGGDGAPQIQVAIDVDRTTGSGEPYLGGFSDTQVDPNAEWEYLIITRFGSGSVDVILWQNGFSTQIFTGSEAISPANDTIEFSIPWGDIEVLGLPVWLRFTVAVFRANQSDDTWDIGGVSDALDAVTNYGDPGDVASNTWADVADGVVNYYFDVFFMAQDGSAEPYPPLLISAALPNPSGAEPAEEYMRVYNGTPWPVPLADYKLGEEETIGGTEGMEQFPGGVIPPGAEVSIANTATAVGFTPDFEIQDSDATPDMANYGTWAVGSLQLNNGGDEILLLDGSDTVVDVALYGSGSYAGVIALSPAPGSDYEMFRFPITQDTDDCSVDFTTTLIPVELVAFEASASLSAVVVSWVTASEFDNLGFYVLRNQVENQTTVRLNADLILGAGTSLDEHTYRFVDNDVEAGADYFYWLEQVDLSGAVSVHGPARVHVPDEVPSTLAIRVSPVPAIDGGVLMFDVPVSGPTAITLYDIQGRVVQNVWKGNLEAGTHSTLWSRYGLRSGIYLMHIRSGSGTAVSRVVLR